MAKPAPEYELVLMLDPELPDERRDEIASETRKRIEDGAELRQERAWGLRKLAYEIRQRTEADYRFFRFANGAGVLEGLEHTLKITDGVLRFRIFKVDPSSPVIDPPPPVPLASAASGRGPRRRDERPPRGPEPTRAPEAQADEAAQGEQAEPAAPAESVPADDAPETSAADAPEPAPAADAAPEPAGDSA